MDEKQQERSTLYAGRYELLGELGKGGMGQVHRALDTATDRMVAIKIIRSDLSDAEKAFARFKREMHATARIEHPNTVRVYDFGADASGELFLTMELLEGVGLDRLVASEAPLGEARACYIGAQIARALVAAHAEGIIHRDLKPSNVMVMDLYGERDVVKVLDFGLASFAGEGDKEALNEALTQKGAFLGTPFYVSPEQAMGHSVDHRSDIYTLGVVLYELVTGQRPFDAENVMGILMKHASAEAQAPHLCAPGHVSEALSTLILRLMSKRASERPQTAAEVLKQLSARHGMLVGASLSPASRATVPVSGVSEETLVLETTQLPQADGALRALPSFPVHMKVALVALVALLLGGVGAWWTLNTGEVASVQLPVDRAPEPETSPAPAVSTALPAPKADVLTPTKAPPVERAVVSPTLPSKVSVVSRPAGAQVRVGETRCVTPCELPLPSMGNAKVRISKRGYTTVTRTVAGGEDRVLSVTLRTQGTPKPTPSPAPTFEAVERIQVE
jgi:serine/threonine protein kinase